ncbi:uncharacterized protein OCT59_006024 [Rhizophagus irregularis]|nr:hypothetical protein RirG_066370 [Rhizophagus irregularis DAOM 197198w]UZO14568.1 hypothetical protein OCT59_006024 [Rhizophagus irregularis]GBC38304.1 hypothetical protein GLOIN_2v1636851 [Rhizophagus irregularis DAOM 181602=DAOM 197198]
MTSIFHIGLSKDFSLILNDADDFNVIIQVGESKNKKEFRAHSVILRARSPYFKRALSSEWITKENDMIVFSKPNITPAVFDMVLKYIYTGELELKKYPGEIILGLLVASDELLLGELFEHVQDYLVKKQTTWVQENFVLVLHTVFKLANCKRLQNYCLESICADPRPFITSENFPSLDKDILYGLLERNDLQIEEIDVWDSLIKWGIEQTPGLGSMNSNRIKWSNINYEALKKTLDSFIPLIRFAEISSAEYFDKVRPYKSIIPYHICEEIEEYYFKGTLPMTTTLPPRSGIIQKIESNIIKPRLSSIIINWIERKDSNYNGKKKDTVYNFNLIYRKSRDGMFNNIQNICTEQGAILVLIQVKYSEKIFGGYNPIGWHNNNPSNNRSFNKRGLYSRNNLNQYLSTKESFIFSFENNEDIKNMKISRVINSSYAIYNTGNGVNFGGSDLNLENGYLSLSHSGNYENLDINLERNRYGMECLDDSDYEINQHEMDQHEVEEIEFFRVKKIK